MPLDTSIAMGVRPVEQPNMLAQMGQVMALRQAQQGYEEQNALKQALSQGVDINDKATFNRLASINPKLAMELRAKELESQKTNAEVGLKRADYLGGAYGDLVKNPTLDNARGILSNAVSLGILTPQHAEQQFATLSADPSKIAELAQKGVQASISAKEKLANATQIRGQDLSYSSSMYGHNVTRQNNEYNQKYPVMNQVTTAQGLGIMPSRGPNAGQIQGVFEPGVAPPPPAPAAAPTPFGGGGGGPLGSGTYGVPNAFVQGAPTNMLRPDAQTPVAGVAPVRAQPVPTAPTLTDVDDPANPNQKLRVDARIYKQGTTLGAPGVLGIARTEKLTPQQTIKLKTEMAHDFKAVDKTIAETNELLKSIDAVRNSNLERVAGPIDARSPTFSDEGLIAETRFANLKGKVTSIAKAASTMTGAIGSIANQEWQILANQIAVLDLKEGKNANLEQIEQLERQALSIANRMRAGFERQYGEHIDTLGPQYREIPDVTYKMGSEGFTPKGQKRPAQSSATPASTGNITDNAGVAKIIDFGSLK